jgi:hypothetical protein
VLRGRAMSCTLVHVYKRIRWNCCFNHQGSELITWHSVQEYSHFMFTFGRTSNFIRFVQPQTHKIHLTKTQSLPLPLQLHVKSQAVSLFNFSLKHFNESIIAQCAFNETHVLYPPSFGYANKTDNQLKTYNFTIHTVQCFPFSSPSLHRRHKGGVSAKPAIVSLSLLLTCLEWSVDNSQHCNMYIVRAYLRR